MMSKIPVNDGVKKNRYEAIGCYLAMIALLVSLIAGFYLANKRTAKYSAHVCRDVYALNDQCK